MAGALSMIYEERQAGNIGFLLNRNTGKSPIERKGDLWES
jgi:hypothetical protein